jgi:hypothetical protein
MVKNFILFYFEPYLNSVESRRLLVAEKWRLTAKTYLPPAPPRFLLSIFLLQKRKMVKNFILWPPSAAIFDVSRRH